MTFEEHREHDDLVDARSLVRSKQQTLHDADAWHQLADVLTYLDARIANLEDLMY